MRCVWFLSIQCIKTLKKINIQDSPDPNFQSRVLSFSLDLWYNDHLKLTGCKENPGPPVLKKNRQDKKKVLLELNNKYKLKQHMHIKRQITILKSTSFDTTCI